MAGGRDAMPNIIHEGESGVVCISYHARGSCYKLCPRVVSHTPLSQAVLCHTRDVEAGDTPNYNMLLSLCSPGDRALALWKVVLINTSLQKNTSLGECHRCCLHADIDLAPLSPTSRSQSHHSPSIPSHNSDRATTPLQSLFTIHPLSASRSEAPMVVIFKGASHIAVPTDAPRPLVPAVAPPAPFASLTLMVMPTHAPFDVLFQIPSVIPMVMPTGAPFPDRSPVLVPTTASYTIMSPVPPPSPIDRCNPRPSGAPLPVPTEALTSPRQYADRSSANPTNAWQSRAPRGSRILVQTDTAGSFKNLAPVTNVRLLAPFGNSRFHAG
jgi:hypothetical protein